MKKVFLTGVTGFIGSHVASQLLHEQIELYALARAQSDLWRIRDIAPKIQFIQGDLLHLESWIDKLIRIKPQICIHTAWDATPGQYLTSPHNIDLLQASLRLAQALEKNGCSRFVGIGTCIEQDTRYGYLSETTPLHPETLYSGTKASLFLTLQQMSLSVAWVRLFQPYGTFESPPRLIPHVISQLLKDKPIQTSTGEQIRDFTYAQDIAEAIWLVALSDLQGAVNLGTGHPRSVRDALTTIGKKLDRLHLIRFGERPSSPNEAPFICANPRYIYEKIGWQPKVTFETGIEQVIQWWQNYLKRGVI